MATPKNLLNEFCEIFVRNETKGGEYGSLANLAPEMTEDEAYSVQFAAIDRMVAGGAVSTGKKIAATNEASQQMLGLAEPAYGELLDATEIANGGTVSARRFTTGRIECELAFKLAAPLQGPMVAAADVIAATEAIYPSLELVDLRTTGWPLSMAEVICYNGLAKHYVLGDAGVAPASLDLIAQTVTLQKDGAQVAEGSGIAVLGDPLAAVAWLANKLAEQERSLQAGDIVLTGSMTPPLPFAAGDRFEADFPGIGKVAVAIDA
jgi:2-keto-4-pentenoate hydratase